MQKPMLIKLLSSVWICILLTACSSAPVKTQTVMVKPDPVWMADCGMPVRAGETLGDYYWWSFDLYQTLVECNARQEAERRFYDAQ